MSETNDKINNNKNIDTTVILLLTISLILNYISVNQNKEYNSNKNIFCGTKPIPVGYGRYGNRYECLKRGYGAGFHRTDKTYPFRKFGYVLIIIVIGTMIYKMK